MGSIVLVLPSLVDGCGRYMGVELKIQCGYLSRMQLIPLLPSDHSYDTVYLGWDGGKSRPCFRLKALFNT